MPTAPIAYPRETNEVEEFDHVTIKGEPATDFLYVITRNAERPPDGDDTSAWLTPIDTEGGGKGYRISGLEHGDYVVWVNVPAPTQHVVIEAGTIRID